MREQHDCHACADDEQDESHLFLLRESVGRDGEFTVILACAWRACEVLWCGLRGSRKTGFAHDIAGTTIAEDEPQVKIPTLPQKAREGWSNQGLLELRRWLA